MIEPSDDQILASAARFLIDGGEDHAASVLLSCSLTAAVGQNDFGEDHWSITLVCPRVAYDILDDGSHAITQAVQRAIEAVLPERMPVWFGVRGQLLEIDPEWRTELLEIARGRRITNQAADAKNYITWMNLRFRSQSEMRVAHALDARGVLFLPNCRARLSSSRGRHNLEPDFLVCFEGGWGILEVDGDLFHPPTRASEDHERDRLFRAYGVRVVERFKADECFENAEAVVSRFLNILKGS
jgi:hypothetical protein